ncbi:hypothetical protein HSX11_12245 [Oxalobacteraceae bacterium]|nr:hypothetical protein [Oxalobacteraceae bacterium]
MSKPNQPADTASKQNAHQQGNQQGEEKEAATSPKSTAGSLNRSDQRSNQSAEATSAEVLGRNHPAGKRGGSNQQRAEAGQQAAGKTKTNKV